jgi:hypothetical protein
MNKRSVINLLSLFFPQAVYPGVTNLIDTSWLPVVQSVAAH